jgi:hypothetical protein
MAHRVGLHRLFGHVVGDDDDRSIERVDATPPVRDVEQPPTDNEHTNPVDKGLQVRMIRRRQRKRDLG